MPTAKPSDARTLINWLLGATATQVMGVFARLDLADAIGDDEARLDDLAEKSEIPPDRMIRLLRACAGMGLCTEQAPGTFALTGAGSLLRKKSAGSLRDLVRLSSDAVTQTPWFRLEDSLRTGRPAFRDVFGMSVFEYFAQNAELSELYNSAMSQRSREAAELIPDYYDFGRFSTVLDVGGGDGTLLTSILSRQPDLRGVVFDTEEGTAQATVTVAAAGLSGRCAVRSGDFFAAVPTGADLHLLKSVLHDWEDDQATTILDRCRAALPAHGRLLIIEPVLPETVPPDAPADAYFSDLNMLVLHGGKERTRTDIEHLCARSGLVLTEVVPLPSQLRLCLIETAPA